MARVTGFGIFALIGGTLLSWAALQIIGGVLIATAALVGLASKGAAQ